MQHILIAVALLSFLVLDLIFVSYSDTPSAALVFGLLSYTILLLLTHISHMAKKSQSNS